jgi:hypothetical protein
MQYPDPRRRSTPPRENPAIWVNLEDQLGVPPQADSAQVLPAPDLPPPGFDNAAALRQYPAPPAMPPPAMPAPVPVAPPAASLPLVRPVHVAPLGPPAPVVPKATPPVRPSSRAHRNSPSVPPARATSSTGRRSTGPAGGTRNAPATLQAVRAAPPWLISMLVHLVLAVILALINFQTIVKPIMAIQVKFAERIGDQDLDDSVRAEALKLTSDLDPALSLDVNVANDPLAATPELPIRLPGMTLNVNREAPSIGMALTGREKGAKNALLAAYGGTATTESAVALALEWLRRNQQRDGSWSLTGPYGEGTSTENRTGATAMALLAFLGNGHTHRAGEHQDVVVKGVKALLKMQDADGLFFHQGVSNHRLYSQAMATIAVCELYGMTQDAELREPVHRALQYAAKIQADDGQGGGGWRYQPGRDVDTSVTGWFVMAYQSARMAGLESYSPVLDRVATYLDHVERVQGDKIETEPNGGLRDVTYHYRIEEIPVPQIIDGVTVPVRDPATDTTTLGMTAEALLCRQYLGWDRTEPRLQAGVSKFLKNPIRWNEPRFYYWYYATQVLHHVGGDPWFEWNRHLREEIPAAQVKAGKERGSWGPAGDQYGYQGGRLYATCFCTYMLEVYYRHLPIYRH